MSTAPCRDIDRKHLSDLGKALRTYAASHDGDFPPDLSEARMQALGIEPDALCYQDPQSGELKDWIYYPGKRDTDLDTPVISTHPSKGDVLVLFATSWVGTTSESEFHALLQPPQPSRPRMSSEVVRQRLIEAVRKAGLDEMEDDSE